MIWTFQRNGEQTQCEVRREGDGDAYELVITHPDGAAEIERFDEPAALIDRSVVCLDRLRQDGWQPVASSQVP